MKFIIRPTQLISSSHTREPRVYTLETRTARCISTRNATRGCRPVQRGSLSSGTTRLYTPIRFSKLKKNTFQNYVFRWVLTKMSTWIIKNFTVHVRFINKIPEISFRISYSSLIIFLLICVFSNHRLKQDIKTGLASGNHKTIVCSFISSLSSVFSLTLVRYYRIRMLSMIMILQSKDWTHFLCPN